jgi:hypothetical protein
MNKKYYYGGSGKILKIIESLEKVRTKQGNEIRNGSTKLNLRLGK